MVHWHGMGMAHLIKWWSVGSAPTTQKKKNRRLPFVATNSSVDYGHAHMDKKKNLHDFPYIHTYISCSVQQPACYSRVRIHSAEWLVFAEKKKESAVVWGAGQPKRLDQQTNQAFIFFLFVFKFKTFFLLALQRHG